MIICCIFFGELVCVGHSFVYVAHFVFLRDVWIRTQRAAVASRCATNLATHLPASHPISLRPTYDGCLHNIYCQCITDVGLWSLFNCLWKDSCSESVFVNV
jgi:hypothetical protein